ncbi:Phospholipase/Carboxylesterase-domain-containing protein [Abortiporus biennis]|nr:Phospholipase/Carboxylesterase-domain-containing protein [Abortiporus biennis]
MATEQPLQYEIIKPTSTHTATVILLHGLGDSSQGFAPVAMFLNKTVELPHVKWIIPTAPTRYVTGNKRTMRAWFDIKRLADRQWGDDSDNEIDMEDSANKIKQIINNEIESTRIPSERIVLCGLSQGGVMTLYTGLTFDKKLGGLAIMSSRIPLPTKIASIASEHVKSLPMFWAHGEADKLVPPEWGIKSVDILVNELGVTRLASNATDSSQVVPGISYFSYKDLEHELGEAELLELRKWILRVVPINTA